MKHAHVAVFSAPGPTHVHPTLCILNTLVRRGYRVSYVTSKRFAANVSELGAEVVLCPRVEFPFNQNKNEGLDVEQQYSPHIIDLAARTIVLVEQFYERNKPDLILYDAAAYAGLVIAQRLSVPSIRTSPQFAFNEISLQSSNIPRAFRDFELDLSGQADEFFRIHGVKGSGIIFNMGVPTVYFYIDDFQLGRHAREQWNLYAGRCAAERPCRPAWKGAQLDGRPSVLISDSTVYRQSLQYFKICAQAFSELQWHTILAIGGSTDPADFEPLPPSCEIVQHMPPVLAMPYVDLMVGPAGMTSTMEAMYHGLPMLMITDGQPELEAYARNVENLGLGMRLRQDAVSVEGLTRCALEMISDANLSSRVQQIQHKVRRSAGAEDVVNWIEEFL
jgi:MGT family glycosyltransferase